MPYKISYIGSVAIGVATDWGRIISFSLPKEGRVPEEFNVGDEVEITNHPSDAATIQMEHNLGYYEITHVASGKVLKTFQKDDEWRLE